MSRGAPDAARKGDVDRYLELARKYFREAEGLYARGDLLQAGEKYWGAVAAMLNAIAVSRGWPHYSHADYGKVVGRLYRETRDEKLLKGFRSAERLHANFYHGFMTRDEFEVHRDAALDLLKRLLSILKL